MGVHIEEICDKYKLFKYKQQLYPQFSLDRKKWQDIPKRNIFEKGPILRGGSFYFKQRQFLRRRQLEIACKVRSLDIIYNNAINDKKLVTVARLQTCNVEAENVKENENIIMRKNKNRKKKQKSIIKMGSCNLRTLACPKSMRKQNALVDVEFKIPFMAMECFAAGIDVLCVQETKLKGEGRISRDGYTLVYSGHSTMRREGVGIFLRDCFLNDIWEIKAVSSRLIWVALKRCDRICVYISIYAPTNKYSSEQKDIFYAQVDAEINIIRSKFGNGVEIYIGGDFNARINCKDDELWNNVRGNFAGDRLNENGLMLLEFCMRNDFKIMNTFFNKKCYGTWQHPRSKSWFTIDYVLVSKNIAYTVLDCGVNLSFDIMSDHRLVECSIRNIRKIIYKKKTVRSLKLDYCKLQVDRQLCIDIGTAVDEYIDQVDSFKDLLKMINEISEKYIPKTIKVNRTKDWFDARKEF